MFGLESILNLGSTVIDKIWPDAGEKEKAKAALAKAAMEGEFKHELAELNAKASVLTTEMQGSWLQRNWRPILMLTIVAIVANNYLLYPYLSLFWPKAPQLELPQDLYSLMKIGVGGYLVGRSAEKVTGKVAEMKRGAK